MTSNFFTYTFILTRYEIAALYMNYIRALKFTVQPD